MKKVIAAIAAAVVVTSCNRFDSGTIAETLRKQSDLIAMSNAQKIFGDIDPDQDWNSIKSGTVTVTADAELDDIVKVQILTESPFFNTEAKVLSEAEVTKGETIDLRFDAPSIYTQLVAACVDSKGIYYIMPFAIGQQSISFKSAATRAANRAAAAGFPDLNSLELKADRSCLSYNAMRTIRANEGVTTNHIDIWKGKGWENERLYTVDDSKEKDLMQNVGPIDETEKAVLTAIFESYLDRKKIGYGNYNKQNNMDAIRNSGVFSLENNHLTSDGETPIILTPVQMASSEIGFCHLYYYYYDPAQTAGMSEEQEVQFLKDLPKYKAIQCYRTDASVWHAYWQAQGDRYAENEFFKKHAYTMVYWGDGQPEFGQKAVSYTFPKGYKIGFMLRKLKTESGDCYNNYAKNSYEYVQNGEVYADGRLNTEINTFPGHFATATEAGSKGNYTMKPDDPRVAIFSANNKTYLTFEDGEDCQFSDMIIEVSGGTQYVAEPQQVEAGAYTMCFEDRPETADYDLNDVVLCCTRVDKTTLQLALVATGANDDVVIHGATGWAYNDMEVHEIFHATEPNEKGNRFVNTVEGGAKRMVMAQYVTVDEGTTIPEYLRNIYIENKTTNQTISIATVGKPPYAIIVPEIFNYPKENQAITSAYLKFVEWAQDANSANDWYKLEETSKIFSNLFTTW